MVTRPFVLLELQDAVHAVLTGDSTLMNMLKGIYDADGVPLNAAFPYVVYGSHVDQSWPTYSNHMNSDALFLMGIWTATDRAEAYRILAEVRRLLDFQKLVMADYASCLFQYEWSTILYYQDMKYWTLSTRYHAYSTELV